ncbi:MAG: hypothetical protein O2904_04435 [bacterium]|nr:hypothetical protein [bacterium]
MKKSYLQRERNGSSKILVIIAIVIFGCATFFLGSKSGMVYEQFTGMTGGEDALQAGNSEESQDRARQIVEEVRKLIVIQDDIDPTVATIIDIDTLKARNPFYEKAGNGDYLIVTPDRAILYSKKQNVILDVVPVQIQQADATQ